jgi:hypothetical protein
MRATPLIARAWQINGPLMIFLKTLWRHLPRQLALNCRWILFEYADGSKHLNPDYSILRSCIRSEMKKVMQEAFRDERMKSLPKAEFKY